MKHTSILLILSFAFVIAACSAIPESQNCGQLKHSVVNNPHYQLLWSKSDISVFGNISVPLMQGIDSHVFVAARISNDDSSRILAIDTNAGNIIWHQNYTPPATIFTDNVNLYVGNYDNIQEYVPMTGQLLKEANFPNVGLIKNMYFNGQNLYALTSSGRWLTYNFNNEESSLSEPLLPYTPFIIENGILYLHDVEGFRAIETNTQKVLWKFQIDEQINIHPLITNDIIIVSTSKGNIYVIDKKTGDLVWTLEAHTISNVAIDATRLYFLTKEGYLKVLDQNSGQEIQKLEFLPASFNLNSPSSDTIIGAYDIWVDSLNNIVVVSLGDSCQLMGIKQIVPQK
jgi:outer membrane protein assembly factor BamB